MAVVKDSNIVESKLGPQCRVHRDPGQRYVELRTPLDDGPNDRGGLLDAMNLNPAVAIWRVEENRAISRA